VYTSPDANVQFFNFDHDSLFSQFKHKIEMNSFFNDDFFNGSQPFGLNQDFFQMDPMMNFKQMEEMINKMKMFQHSDSNFIYPQQNNQPPKNNSTPNMITL
jgi:hypothetical protein